MILLNPIYWYLSSVIFWSTAGLSNPEQTSGQDCSRNCQVGMTVTSALCGIGAVLACIFAFPLGCFIGATLKMATEAK